jgi:hypothetical protein
MIQYILLGLAVIVGLTLLAFWFVSADPGRVVKTLKWVGTVILVILLLLFLFLRRFDLMLYLLAFGLPLWGAWLARARRAKALRGATPGQASEVKTRYLRMILHHDSGEMQGEVLEGQFRGARLDQLNMDDLVELWRECQDNDLQSAAVLEAYLDRAHGQDWREAASARFGEGGAPRGSSAGAMTEEEALAILGLEAGAKEREIIEAHRRLMQKVHPDHGGSNYLASKINEAKDLLIARTRGRASAV